MKSTKALATVDLLVKNGIQAKDNGVYVVVNRDSICNSRLAVGSGMPEETAYPAILKFINDNIEGHFYWIGKTDDDLFLDCMEKI